MIHGSKTFLGGLHAITILRWLQWKKIFRKFSKFRVLCPLWSFGFFLTIFSKLRGRKISKFRFMGQFLTLKNMVTKFFQNSNFSDFLGIKSEISQYVIPITYTRFHIRHYPIIFHVHSWRFVGKLLYYFRSSISNSNFSPNYKKFKPETNLSHPEPIIQRWEF